MSGRHDGIDVTPDLSLFNILLLNLAVPCGLVEVKLMVPSIGPSHPSGFITSSP